MTEIAVAPLSLTAVLAANTAPSMGFINRYDSTAANRTPVLPPLSGQSVSAYATIRKQDASANSVTVTTTTGDVFDDNSTSFTLTSPGEQQTVQVVSIGASKFWTKLGAGGAGGGSGGTAAATPNTLALRDANANLTADNFIVPPASTVTAGTITTLTIADPQVQVFTGTSTHTVKLPTTSVVAGQRYRIVNQSTGTVTVQSSGANTITTVTASTTLEFVATVATPTTAAQWMATPTIKGAARIEVVLALPGTPDPNTVYIINGPNVPRLANGTTTAGAISINLDACDVFTATLTAATTLAFTGTFKHAQEVLVEFVDNGTSRAITWPSNTGDSGVATRLAATVANKVHRVFLAYDVNKTKLICMAVDAVGY